MVYFNGYDFQNPYIAPKGNLSEMLYKLKHYYIMVHKLHKLTTLVLAYSSPVLLDCSRSTTNSNENELKVSLFSIIDVSAEKLIPLNCILPLPLKLAECTYC